MLDVACAYVAVECWV